MTNLTIEDRNLAIKTLGYLHKIKGNPRPNMTDVLAYEAGIYKLGITLGYGKYQTDKLMKICRNAS